jgi:hypothetical protein
VLYCINYNSEKIYFTSIVTNADRILADASIDLREGQTFAAGWGLPEYSELTIL